MVSTIKIVMKYFELDELLLPTTLYLSYLLSCCFGRFKGHGTVIRYIYN